MDASREPLGEALMYNDGVKDAEGLAAIAQVAPATSGAHGATSGLAKAIVLRRRGANCIVHQADWIASRFSGRLVTDANNALKTGYDPVAGRWPDWIASLEFDLSALPPVVAPATIVARVTPEAVEVFGLSAQTRVVAGTTDGAPPSSPPGRSAPATALLRSARR